MASSRHFPRSGLKDLVFGAYFDQPLEDVDFPEGLDTRPARPVRGGEVCEMMVSWVDVPLYESTCVSLYGTSLDMFLYMLQCFKMLFMIRGNYILRILQNEGFHDRLWNHLGSISWSSVATRTTIVPFPAPQRFF